VRTDFGYHLIEVLDQSIDAESGEVYEIEARHILLKVNPGTDTIDLLVEAAQGFRDRVDGSSFVTTAEAEAVELTSPAEFQEGRDIPSLPLSLTGSNWVFANETGDVSPVFENRDSFYIILVGQKTEAGTSPLAEVAAQVTLAIRKDKHRAAAKVLLDPAVGDVQMGRTMAEAAGNAGLVYAVTDTFTVNGNIPEVGYGTDFNKMAIEGEVGQVVPEVATLRGLYALSPVWIKSFDEEDFLARGNGIRNALNAQAENQVIQDWYEAKLAVANVEDLRFSRR